VGASKLTTSGREMTDVNGWYREQARSRSKSVLRSKNAIARVAESGHDVGMLIQV
jgi:hypothetical protein